MLAMDSEPLLRSAIIESLFDAKAHEDFLEARGARVMITLEMLRWTLVSPEGRRKPGPLMEWSAASPPPGQPAALGQPRR